MTQGVPQTVDEEFLLHTLGICSSASLVHVWPRKSGAKPANV